MAAHRFPVIPGSLRQRVLAQLSTEQPRSGPEVCAALGFTERRDRVNVFALLSELVADGHLVRSDFAPRVGQHGRPPRTYLRLTEPQTRERRRFESARKVVEAAGFVLVPRRVSP